MFSPVAASRHVRGATANIAVTWDDEDGEAATAAGVVTVRVQKGDGTDVVVAGSSTTGSNSYMRQLTPAQTATLERLTATWTDAGSGATRQTLHDVVGGVYFTVARAREIEPTLAGDPFTSAAIKSTRREVEEECEEITGWAWVPRYERVTLDGRDDCELLLPHGAVRTVRSVRVYTDPTTYTAFTAAELAELVVYEDGRIVRPNGDIFDAGQGNVVVEYEHGFDRPPKVLQHACIRRLRWLLNLEIARDTARMDEAVRINTPDGSAFEVAGEDLDVEQATVLRTYRKFSRKRRRAVSRTFDYDPSRFTLYHGGRR